MSKFTTNLSKKEAFLEKREALKKMSAGLQQLVKSGALESVNEGLKQIYEEQGHAVLKSFHQWKKEGKKVRKGEKALLLWGRPQKGKEKEEGTESDYTYYPVSYVFSDRQVEEPAVCYDTIDAVRLVREKSDILVKKIGSPEDAALYAWQFYKEDIEIYESAWAVFLDRSNKTVGYTRISQGGISGTVVDIRLILKYALDTLASGVILVHNHPSGNLLPSSQDSALTRKLKEACKWMDITLIDHIILTKNEYYSFGDNGTI